MPRTQTYNGSNTDECLFEKVNDWQYENEYRMVVRPDDKTQYISIDGAVTGIYITLNFMAAGYRYSGARCLGILTGKPNLIHEFQFSGDSLRPCAHIDIDSGVRGGTYQTLRHWFDSELVLTYDFLSRLLKGEPITDYSIFKSQIKCLLAGLDYNIVDGGSVATINEDREKYVKETRSRILEEICKRGVVTSEELHKMGICKECNFKK